MCLRIFISLLLLLLLRAGSVATRDGVHGVQS
eukprot:COSAG05_NODE_18908_length_301_cov_0.232673_1_plen_31_part_10